MRMITRRRIPLSPHVTDLDRRHAGELHEELAADIREVVSQSVLPRALMAIVVVHPDGDKAWLAEQLKRAGFDSEVCVEPDDVPVIVTHRHTVRAAFEGTPVAAFLDSVADDRFAICYGLPGKRWVCAAPPELPVGRGQA